VTNTGGNVDHLFTGNDTYIFTFRDLAGNTGTATATVTRIDTLAPEATLVMYTPTTATNAPVIATLLTNKPVLRPLDWEGPATGTSFTQTFDDNFSGTVSFTDLVGKTGQT
jgi:hypothetical protein